MGDLMFLGGGMFVILSLLLALLTILLPLFVFVIMRRMKTLQNQVTSANAALGVIAAHLEASNAILMSVHNIQIE